MNEFSVHGRLPSPPSDPNSGLCLKEGSRSLPDKLPRLNFRQPRGFQWA